MGQARVPGIMLVALFAVGAGGCKDDPTELAPFPSEGEVFTDEFGSNVTYQAFAGSKPDAVQVDPVERYAGDASLRVAVPGPGDPSGTYAGGAFTTDIARDLTEFDALTFWARASTAATLDVAGIGNDNTGTSRYTAERRGLSVGTSWAKYVIPIPLASRLTAEEGLFYFAEGPEANQANTIWFDEIQFETLGTLADPRPSIGDQDVSVSVGATVEVTGTEVTFDVAGTDVTVQAAPGYFTFTSSDEAVATVDEDGVITVVGDGTATITAELGSTGAAGSVVVSTVTGPGTAAPTPTAAEADVISLFSNAYADVAVDTWSADWDDADVEDIQVQGDDVKLYTNLVFAGIEFGSAPVDASAMTRFHMDIWTPDATADPAELRVKLVDFGADGAFGGGDDVEHELTFTDASSPPLATESWVSLDIPLSDFTNLTTRGALAQLIISGDPNTVYVDNVYFYDDGSGGAPTAPASPAPTPTAAEADVISLYSDAYTDVAVDAFLASFSVATLTDTAVAGDSIKKYGDLDFAGIEFVGPNSIDASGMTHVHMDIWTPDATLFGFKFVDFGADNAFGGGDDSEHTLVQLDASSTPPLTTGGWISLDIALSDLTSTGLASLANLSQLILTAQPTAAATVYVDNIYFYDDGSGGGAPTAPASPAPAPTAAEADVISLYSDAYTDVTVDTWSASWDAADVADDQVAGDNVKLYTNLVFAGIEFLSAPVDASAMTHFHMDIWTPDATADPAELRVKLVDLGGDGAIGTGDDVEHELTFTAASTPPLATGSWVSLDIPLSDFANLTTRGALGQLIISGDPNTVYVDNVYFYDDGSGGAPSAPASPAPTPTVTGSDVISLYSDAYTDVTVDTWSASWDAADVADDQVSGDNVKLYTNLDFAGIEFVGPNSIDASGMTHVHMDIWTPDATLFGFKFVDFGADNAFGGGDDSEHTLVQLDASSTPPLTTGGWISLDIALSDLTSTGLASLANLSQLILTAQPTAAATVYVDNIYFYR